jgi:hypothetical protein
MRQLAIVLLVVFAIGAGAAQDSVKAKPGYLHAGKIGIGLDGITGSSNLMMKYFFNNQLALQVILGANVYQPGGDAAQGQTKRTGLDLRGGLSVLFHLSQEQLSPYLGVEGIFQQSRSAGFFTTVPDPANAVFASGVFGAEFFLSEKFTCGLRQGLGVKIALKRDVPKEESNLWFDTSTLLTARFYFN